MFDEGSVMGATGGTVREGSSHLRFTVLGLFEDTLDMERALIALRRAKRSPSEISVLLRDRDAEAHVVTAGAVSRAVSEHTLEAVGGWLIGLAELILADRGTFLVAGPIGAALASAPDIAERATNSNDDQPANLEPGAPDQNLAQTLVYFGFSQEEANYLAHRLDSGDAVVALTTHEPNLLRETRRLFANCDAVHIGQAQTEERVFRDAQIKLARPAKAAKSEIVVTDAVDPFVDYCRMKRPPRWVSELCGSTVLDDSGTEIGFVDEILGLLGEERDDEHLRQNVRYVVIRFGRVLGIGRRRAAIPKDLINLDKSPLEVQAPAGMIHRAPAYNPESPFSRSEEEVIFSYFGAQPYWAGRSAKPSPA
jgi:hypothetical protein